MHAGVMSFCHQARIVPGDAKAIAVVADRFEQTFMAEVEENKLIGGLQVLGD